MKALSDPLNDRIIKDMPAPPHHFLSENLLFNKYSNSFIFIIY